MVPLFPQPTPGTHLVSSWGALPNREQRTGTQTDVGLEMEAHSSSWAPHLQEALPDSPFSIPRQGPD